MTCCPKCGGTRGYAYEMQVKHHMVGSWGETAECGDSTRTSRGFAACMDCGKHMRVETAERAPSPTTKEST